MEYLGGGLLRPTSALEASRDVTTEQRLQERWSADVYHNARTDYTSGSTVKADMLTSSDHRDVPRIDKPVSLI